MENIESNNELSLYEKILIELDHNAGLYPEVKKVLLDLLGKMIQYGFTIDESILPKVRELSVVTKPKYKNREKKYELNDNEIEVSIDTIYEEKGLTIAMEVILNALFPNKDPKTEALYQNMVKGIVNTFVGDSNMTDQFRVNELMSLIAGCDSKPGLRSHPLFLAFCQGNMSICLENIKVKLINSGLSVEEAEKQMIDLLALLDYNNNRKMPHFLRNAQRMLSKIFFLTNPSEEQVLNFKEQLIFSPDLYETVEEKKSHASLNGFKSEFQSMIIEYYNARNRERQHQK